MPEPVFDVQDVLEGFSQPAAILAEGRRIVAANRRFRDRFAAGDDPRGRTCHELLHGLAEPCDKKGMACPLSRCLVDGRPSRAFHRHRSKIGEEPVELSVCEVTRRPGGIAFFLHLTRHLPSDWLPDELRALER